MNRRRFLRLSAAVPFIASALMGDNPANAANETIDWNHYRVTTQVDVPATTEAVQLWLPLPATRLGEYQRAQTPHWKVSDDGKAKLMLITPYNTLVLHVTWPTTAHHHSVPMPQSVRSRNRHIELYQPPAKPVKLTAEEMALYLKPPRYLPTDGIVAKTANKIIQGRGDNKIVGA